LMYAGNISFALNRLCGGSAMTNGSDIYINGGSYSGGSYSGTCSNSAACQVYSEGDGDGACVSGLIASSCTTENSQRSLVFCLCGSLCCLEPSLPFIFFSPFHLLLLYLCLPFPFQFPSFSFHFLLFPFISFPFLSFPSTPLHSISFFFPLLFPFLHFLFIFLFFYFLFSAPPYTTPFYLFSPS
jgi:hypothetical protein